MNYIEKIAEMLGVKLEEVFTVKDSKKAVGKYKFTLERGLVDVVLNIEAISVLWCLLIGECTIEKEPFIPKYGEIYYCVNWDEHIMETYCQKGFLIDILRVKLGNCYRTQEEAEADRQKWIDYFNDPSVNKPF